MGELVNKMAHHKTKITPVHMTDKQYPNEK
jgi:hypothetical protein